MRSVHLAWALALAVGLLFLAGGAADATTPYAWQTGMQPGVTPIQQRIEDFHDFILVIIAAITLFVLVLLIWVMVRYNERRNPVPTRTAHHTVIEVLWTVVPVLILIVIAIPSFRLLYFQETTPPADLTVKATAYSWYWNYEYADQGGLAFDSLIMEDEEPRLFAVDNEMVVPVNKVVRVITTSGDVIHSFAMPAFGVKKDSVPGRLNETWFMAERTGTYYGQCSEICGARHAYMPIAVHVVEEDEFNAWSELAQAGDLEGAYQRLAELVEVRNKLAAAPRQ